MSRRKTKIIGMILLSAAGILALAGRFGWALLLGFLGISALADARVKNEAVTDKAADPTAPITPVTVTAVGVPSTLVIDGPALEVPSDGLALSGIPYLGREHVNPAWGLALCLDCETTGLDPNRHEVLEVACVLFAFDLDTCEVKGIVEEYVGLQEPRGRIPRAASEVHGITRKMVKGRALDRPIVERLAGEATFVVAHNARFDRAFCHQVSPRLLDCTWRCSLYGIDWTRRGFRSRKLQDLMHHHSIQTGQAHRGLEDVHGLIALLNQRGKDGSTYLATLVKWGPVAGGVR